MRIPKIIIAFLFAFACNKLAAQPLFSLMTDFAVSRNLAKDQRYFSFGQTVRSEIHFTDKDGAYVWYNYNSAGKFKNNLTANAKDPLTIPSYIDFKSAAALTIKSFSIGWKHYLVGASNSEVNWNLYFMAGFGLLSGKAKNTFDTPIDTSKYFLPANPVNGEGKFKRLTFDAVVGYEVPIGMAIYLYGEGRAFIPASNYPNKYLFANDNAPFLISASLGLRILFD